MSIKGKEKEVVEDYVNNGFTLSQLEKKYHTDYRAIKAELLKNNIKIKSGGSFLRKEIFPGQRFNMLTVVKEVEPYYDSHNKKRDRFFLFRCDCGKEKVIRGTSVWQGETTNCGCVSREVFKKNAKLINYKHGQSSTRLYRIWQSMKRRCYTKTSKSFELYGGRGIKICNEWNSSFPKFQEWALNNGYLDTLTLDRIDVNGNYEPSNCRWATMKEQSNNTRKNHYLTYKEIKATISFWRNVLKIPNATFYKILLDYDWNLEQYLNDNHITINMNFEVNKK